MGLKNLLKKIKCKMTFCIGTKCSYNEEGKGRIKINDIDINEIIEDYEFPYNYKKVESSV
jgi:hypothetical protein